MLLPSWRDMVRVSDQGNHVNRHRIALAGFRIRMLYY
jgi:hypothetical protein